MNTRAKRGLPLEQPVYVGQQPRIERGDVSTGRVAGRPQTNRLRAASRIYG